MVNRTEKEETINFSLPRYGCEILRWACLYVCLTFCQLAYFSTTRPASDDRTARRQFQATGQLVSRTQASDAMTSRLPRYEAKCLCNAGASNAGRSLCVQISRERSYPLPIYWYHSKGNWLRYNFAAESFYIMKHCSRLFVLHCRSRPKYDTSMHFDLILRKLGAA